jgi:hypothetical protein
MEWRKPRPMKYTRKQSKDYRNPPELRRPRRLSPNMQDIKTTCHHNFNLLTSSGNCNIYRRFSHTHQLTTSVRSEVAYHYTWTRRPPLQSVITPPRIFMDVPRPECIGKKRRTLIISVREPMAIYIALKLMENNTDQNQHIPIANQYNRNSARRMTRKK